MIIAFKNLNEEEKRKLYELENENPECSVREIKESFDGQIVVQLIVPALIEAAAIIIAALIEKKNKEPEYQITINIIVNGNEEKIESEEDLEKAKGQYSQIG